MKTGNLSSTYLHSHKQTYTKQKNPTSMNELNGASRTTAIIKDVSNLGRLQR